MTRTRHLIVGLMMTGLVDNAQLIAWAGKPYPGTTIDGHVVRFGQILSGEVGVVKMSQRLTMMPLEPGSAVGDRALGDVQDNATWS